MQLDVLSSDPAKSASPAGPRRVRVLGRYRLLHELGAGATATVYLGRLEAAAGFKRLVAVKAVHARLAGDERFVASFLEGARAAARLAHPCIAAVLEMGKDGDTYWVATEYVHGEPLCDLVAACAKSLTRMPWTIAFRVIADVADALHAVHEARGPGGEPLGLVHGALSASSVLVGYDGVVKVVDIGAPKVSPRTADTAPSLLRRHVPYAAPEQLRGEPVDRRADVFSAGVLLWELVTGQRLYASATELDVLAKAERGDVPSVRTAVPALPERVDAVVRKAVAVDPSARYATTRELSRALTTTLLHSGLYAGTDELAELVQTSFRERRLAREEELEAAEDATEIFHRPPSLAPAVLPPRPAPPRPDAHAASSRSDAAPPPDAPVVARTNPPPPLVEEDADPTLVAPSPFHVIEDAALERAAKAAPHAAAGPDSAPQRRRLFVGMMAAGAFLALASAAVLAFPTGARGGAPMDLTAVSAASPARVSPVEPTAGPAAPAAAAAPSIAATPVPPAPRPPEAMPVVGASPNAKPARPPLPAGPAAGTVGSPRATKAGPAVAAPRPVDDEDIGAGRASQGMITVVCYPACDEVTVDRDKVGPSPLFKHSVAPGRHRVVMRTVDPPVTKALDVVVVGGEEPTVVRQSMAR